MKTKQITFGGAVAGATMMLMGSTALAQDCGPEGQSIRILGSDFPAIQAIANTAQALCGDAASEFTVTLRDDTRDMMNQAQTPNPAQYTSVIVANSTLTQLMNDGLVRPLNDLVEAYGENIQPSQLITIEGNVMAVAFMANSQHLFSRMDILEEVGITEPPATVEEVLAAAEAIREAGIMEHPIVMNASNLFYFGHGGQLFEPGTAQPNINNETGVATLETMAALAEYAHPDYLSHASNETQGIWEAGQAALGRRSRPVFARFQQLVGGEVARLAAVHRHVFLRLELGQVPSHLRVAPAGDPLQLATGDAQLAAEVVKPPFLNS